MEKENDKTLITVTSLSSKLEKPLVNNPELQPIIDRTSGYVENISERGTETQIMDGDFKITAKYDAAYEKMRTMRLFLHFVIC